MIREGTRITILYSRAFADRSIFASLRLCVYSPLVSLIVLLIDGVGLAPLGPTNPVAGALPKLTALLGAPLAAGLNIAAPRLLGSAIDATLGIAGLPQSGSGHASIWGGFNAAALGNRHQPSYPTVAMRERLAASSLLLDAQRAGARVAWANAYLPGYSEAVASRRLRHTAGTWAALAAGLALRGVEELRTGTALSWDITQRLAHTRPGIHDLPLVVPEDAGMRLAALGRVYDIVAFETYLPDLAAHNRIPFDVAQALEAVDELLAGAVGALAPGDTLVATSDHGNSEDATTRIHTRNPVPLLAFGPAAARLANVASIDGLAPALIAAL